MTEQELRAAVAEYDAELAREMESRYDNPGPSDFYLFAEWNEGNPVTWYVCDKAVIREEGCYSQESDVLISHAATMRAMDAAAKAFEEALK